jgi:hypothetical protein
MRLRTPVLRYSEEPGRMREEPGSSEYLRTGVVGITNAFPK